MPKRRTPKPARKGKPVAYRFIPPETLEGRPMYLQLARLVEEHHSELVDARIALAWHLRWKPDVDGRVTLGQCKRVGDLERELHDADGRAYDFVIILRKDYWEHHSVSDLQRRALLDHELCHATVKYDDRGEPARDERGRLVYRTRKHDLEEFACIAGRYGVWKADLEAFAEALEKARGRSTEWIGYSRLHDDLYEAGLSLTMEVIATWSDQQRREARTWALLRNTPTPDGRSLPLPTMPAFLETALAQGAPS